MQEQAEHLIKLVEEGDFPHLLVYGPPGAGKKVYSYKENFSYIGYIISIHGGEAIWSSFH
jgi:hypothetical protein